MEEDRIQKAVELFKSGYNCSQSVVAAFADMYGFTQEQALRMADVRGCVRVVSGGRPENGGYGGGRPGRKSCQLCGSAGTGSRI